MADEVANVALTKVVPTETTLKPYYDDFDENKNFHRVVFKPGYAVQARELTQMQTIQQNQIERFGSHVFENGSIVQGGQISISNATYINLKTQYAATDIKATNFVGQTINDSSGNTTFEATVIAGREKQGNSSPVLLIAYRSGQEFVSSQTIKASDTADYATIVDDSGYTGKGIIATINDGIFFFNGYFVKKPKETIIIDPYTTYANVKIGLEFTQTIISENDDTSLLDPAQEASNYQAPGADRLKIELKFTTRPLDSTDEESFIELMRVVNGVKTKQTVYPIYSVLGETFARRTYDESGHYTVQPFRARIADHPTDDTKLRLFLSAGKAYVKGYELETISENYIDIDRARDTQTLNNIDILANYGNDTILKELYGIVDVSTMPIVDLHCVPHQQLDTSTSTLYSQTKIGTARIRSFEYYSASNTADPQTHTFDASLFDLNFTNISTNVSSFTSNTVILNNANNVLTSANGAYAGGTLRFTSGNANGSSYLITEYNGSNNWFLLNKPLTTSSVTNADTVSIDGSFAIVESICSNVLYTPDATQDMIANIADTNRNSSGYTYLFDQKLNSLIFKAPYKFIAPGLTKDQQYTYSKVFASAVFGGGTCSISVSPTREAFNGVDGSGTSSTTLDNFIVIRQDTGDIIPLSSVTVNASTGLATLTAAEAGLTCNAIVIAKVNLNSGPNVNPKAKTLNTANTDYFTTSSVSGTFTSTELGSTIAVYLDGSQAVITNPTKTSGLYQSLHVSDVKKITAIYDLEGASLVSGASISGYKNVTSRFSFNNGQKESHYDYATIQLKPRQTAPVGPLVVCFDWYDHVSAEGDDKGYFSVDSYPEVNTTAGYGDIPQFVDTNGVTYELRDCIDFRPRRKNCLALTSSKLEGIRIPNQATTFGCDLGYFLARADLLVVSKDSDTTFVVQKGSSSLSPVYPKSIEGTMPIYKINLNPYTVTKDDVNLTYIENKRYTMRDIGVLEQRIQNLEYYTSLSILEKTATDMVIKDPNGLDRTKNGILVDNFFTHGIGDVWSPDYFISMDKVYGAAAPPVNTSLTKFFIAENSSTKSGKKYTTLEYTETPAIIQSYATKGITIQPYQVSKYIGKMVMDPPGDFWTDQQKAPDLVVNVNGENDNSVLGQQTGGAPPQQDHNRAKFQTGLWKYDINVMTAHDGTLVSRSLLGGGVTVNGLRSTMTDSIKSTHHDNMVWNTSRSSITSSWFGKNTR